MNLTMLLEMAAAAHGDRVAVQCGAEVLRYEELLAASGHAARELQASGAEHLALLDVSSLAAPVALFAAARAGLPYVPLNYRLTGGELDALLERIAPARLVTDPERAASFAPRTSTSVAARDAFLASARAASDAPTAPDDPEGIAVLLFTSGTTGAPKAAVLRHRHLVSYVLGSVEFASAGEDEATLVSVPPYHVAGVAAILSSVYAGRRIVQLPTFSPEAWLAAARSERVTHAFVVPTMLARIVDALAGRTRADLPHLRSLSYGGGKMPLPVIERALRALPGGRASRTPTGSPRRAPRSRCSAPRSIGPRRRAATPPCVAGSLPSVGRSRGSRSTCATRKGSRLPPARRARSTCAAPQVSGEYLGRGSQLGPQGWFPTRDAGFVDDDGLPLPPRAPRRRDRARRREPLARRDRGRADEHPSVAECAVVGVADVEWGEVVAAAVVLAEGASASEDELRAWVRDGCARRGCPRASSSGASSPTTRRGSSCAACCGPSCSEGAR